MSLAKWVEYRGIPTHLGGISKNDKRSILFASCCGCAPTDIPTFSTFWDSDKLRNLIQEYCRVNLLDFNKIWNIYSINPNTKRWLKPLMPQGKPLNFETYCNYLGDVSIYKDYESACAFVHGQDIASKILPFTFYDSICYRFVMMMSYIFRTIRLFPLNEDMETQITNLEDGLMMLSQKYIHN